MALGANPGSGTLAGTATVAAASGVATFANLSINKAGTGYTLTASASGPTGATSNPFTVSAAAATQLAFTVQPTTGAAGAALTPAVQVTARDAQGNVATDFTGTVTVALGINPGSATLSGTISLAAVSGVATFSSLSIDKVGTGYTLTAVATGLSGATSVGFNITAGAATELVFTVEPSNAAAGSAITPAVHVTAQDAHGNIATAFTGTVTLGLGTNPGGGTLSGTATAAAVNGVATFANVSINKAGTGYTLTAAATGVTGTTSAAFNVTAGGATRPVFTVQPSNAIAAAAITPAVQVTAQDALGNTDPSFSGSVTMAFGVNPAGGTLSGTTTVAAVGGVATFSTLRVDKSGTGYALSATATGLSAATSTPFNVTSGTATRLAFTVQPTNTMAGATITPAVEVTAQDAFGNTVPGFTGNVTAAITPGTGAPGATLSGTRTVAAVGGVATFSGLSIDKTGTVTGGTGYTLSATATGLAGATSAPFDINPGAPTQLAFTIQPTTATAGAHLAPPVEVAALDAMSNTVPGFTGNVTVTIGTNPAGGTVSGTTTVAAASAVATFPNLSRDKSGTGYTLAATATGLSGATSAAFTITSGPATHLVFTVQPSTAAANGTIAPAVRVTARDALGNTATGFQSNVTVAIGTNPAGGTLSGTTMVAAVGGVATLSDLRVDKSGSGYTLSAAGAGLTGATSGAFSVVPGAAAQLVFTVQPSTATAGASITPQVEVSARDGLGNTATGFTGNIALSIGTNPASGTLAGTTTVAAVAGVATFPTLSIDRAGSGYTLAAGAAGPAGTPSAPFDITSAPATRLVFTVQPTTTTAGAGISPAVQLTVHDAVGKTGNGLTGDVTLTITTGT